MCAASKRLPPFFPPFPLLGSAQLRPAPPARSAHLRRAARTPPAHLMHPPLPLLLAPAPLCPAPPRPAPPRPACQLVSRHRQRQLRATASELAPLTRGGLEGGRLPGRPALGQLLIRHLRRAAGTAEVSFTSFLEFVLAESSSEARQTAGSRRPELACAAEQAALRGFITAD